MKTFQTLIATTACVLSLSVSAQWQWIDKDGHKVFSDRAPPVDVPEKNILKQPSSRARVSDAPAAAGTDMSQGAAVAPTKINGVDKELTERKKQAEAAEAAKNRATDELVAKMQAENCTRARQAKAALDAGQRIARTNAQGEREFLDNTGRAEEAQRLQTIIDSDCK